MRNFQGTFETHKRSFPFNLASKIFLQTGVTKVECLKKTEYKYVI